MKTRKMLFKLFLYSINLAACKNDRSIKYILFCGGGERVINYFPPLFSKQYVAFNVRIVYNQLSRVAAWICGLPGPVSSITFTGVRS